MLRNLRNSIIQTTAPSIHITPKQPFSDDFSRQSWPLAATCPVLACDLGGTVQPAQLSLEQVRRVNRQSLDDARLPNLRNQLRNPV